jgi:hypothetical protein
MEICQSLNLENRQLRTAMQQQSSEFKAKLENSKFSVDTIPSNSFTFFTGFPNKEIFESVLEFLNPGPNGENLVFVRNEAKNEEDSTTSSAMVVQELHERVRRTRRKPICECHRVENTEKYFRSFLSIFNPF